ncbi:hypothetical protein OUZ56_021540 [Daphnia magna]|uniref:Tc1-like transposase DDE domain-containing protein n=1 Tax=Daphnia magna TaxID=35525 RepID=A0ABQ9ZHP0_9CRUS|nr:hypothetical protein OUZ56_021540 [Daphnia magna]
MYVVHICCIQSNFRTESFKDTNAIIHDHRKEVPSKTTTVHPNFSTERNDERFNTKGVVSSYTGTERTSIPHSVGVVACISQPFNKGCNLIRQVETRIDSQQYTSFLMEIVSSYPTVGLISIVHDKYPVHNSTKVKSWLAGQQRMSVFSYWPPASGDLMPIETVFLDILKEFDEHETRVHSVKALWEEIQNAFAAVTEKEDYKLSSGFLLLFLNAVFRHIVREYASFLVNLLDTLLHLVFYSALEL